MIAPFVTVGRAHQAWTEIGASPWLVRQLRFGLQLPWIRKPRNPWAREYHLSPEDLAFSRREAQRWVDSGYCRQASGADLHLLRRCMSVSPAFVTVNAKKFRLVIDYSLVNECLDERSFRIDQLADLSPSLRPDDCLLKAYIKNTYYHLRLRKEDQLYLAFRVGGVTYIPACPKFRAFPRAVVIYKDDATGCRASAVSGPPSILLPRRFLRSGGGRTRGKTGIGGRHTEGRSGSYPLCSVGSACGCTLRSANSRDIASSRCLAYS
jgi:hypothetical protein